MKKLILALTLIVSSSSFAGNKSCTLSYKLIETITYENDEDTNESFIVEASDFYYVVSYSGDETNFKPRDLVKMNCNANKLRKRMFLKRMQKECDTVTIGKKMDAITLLMTKGFDFIASCG